MKKIIGNLTFINKMVAVMVMPFIFYILFGYSYYSQQYSIISNDQQIIVQNEKNLVILKNIEYLPELKIGLLSGTNLHDGLNVFTVSDKDYFNDKLKSYLKQLKVEKEHTLSGIDYIYNNIINSNFKDNIKDRLLFTYSVISYEIEPFYINRDKLESILPIKKIISRRNSLVDIYKNFIKIKNNNYESLYFPLKTYEYKQEIDSINKNEKIVNKKIAIKKLNLEHNQKLIKELTTFKSLQFKKIYEELKLENMVITKRVEVNTDNFKISILLTVIFSILGLYILINIILNMYKSINVLSEQTRKFFRFMNSEEKDLKGTSWEYRDEIGEVICEFTNKMIEIKEDIKTDQKFINELSDSIKEIEDGNFDISLLQTPNNKEIRDLKTKYNNLLLSLQNKFGDNLDFVIEDLDSFSNLNFKRKNRENNLLKILINKLSIDLSKMLNNHLNDINEVEQESINISEITTVLNREIVNQEEKLNVVIEDLETNNIAMKDMSVESVEMLHLAEETKEETNQGTELLTMIDKSITEMRELIAKVAHATMDVEQIAFQTNILSLNAAVEAATAGEDGKGFAVVANEVRNLASKSANVAQDIKKLVEESIKKSDENLENSSKVLKSFDNISKKTEETYIYINKIVENIENTNEAYRNMDNQIMEVKDIGEENIKIINNISIRTDKLNELTHNFKLDLSKIKFYKD